MTTLYASCVPQMGKMLANLDSWLDMAVAYAEERGFDPELLLNERLNPDMFNLTRQIQAACDTAKFAGARLAQVEAASDPDTETTLEELRARIKKTIAGLEALTPEQFEGAEERELKLRFLPEGKATTGLSYFVDFAQPNFYFHVSMAYGLLRRSGVKLGKRTYIGGMTLHDAAG